MTWVCNPSFATDMGRSLVILSEENDINTFGMSLIEIISLLKNYPDLVGKPEQSS